MQLVLFLLIAATALVGAHPGHGQTRHRHRGAAAPLVDPVVPASDVAFNVHPSKPLGVNHVRSGGRSAPPVQAAVPFNLSQVSLTPGSRFAAQAARNRAYLFGLDSTRLACIFTSSANLTGTWEHPTCNPYGHPQYWGHYLGHWLSATAMTIASDPSDAALAAKASAMVSTLANVQATWTASNPASYSGYLFPYARTTWDNLLGFNGPSRNCDPVCVPFYTLHKLLAGMLDQHVLAGNAQALDVAIGMATWACAEVDGVFARGGDSLWQSVLDTEWGGFNDGLYNLYRLTGTQSFATCAEHFVHWVWTDPLAEKQDALAGWHANTHIPEIIGDLNGYGLTGNDTKMTIAETFFQFVTTTHSWATGGSNHGEYWQAPMRMGDSLDGDTEESCTSYNVLKVAKSLYGLSADPALMDYYEGTLWNAIVGNQNTDSFASPSVGFIYMLPQGPGSVKPWGDGVDGGFPCCWGTLSETFAKLQDTIFAFSGSTIFVNLFVPATLSLPSGVTITQTTSFPSASGTTITVTVPTGAPPAALSLALRIPSWTSPSGTVVTLDGVAVPVSATGYLTLPRTSWAAGSSVLVASFPASLSVVPLADDRPQWSNTGAIKFGNILLAWIGVSSPILPLPPAAQLASAIVRTGGEGDPLRFAYTVPGCPPTVLMPLADVVNEVYSLYITNATGKPAVGYNASGTVLPGGGPLDFTTGGGASITPNGNDENIRSGDPGDQAATVSFSTAVVDAAHRITGLSFDYQYTAGYGAAGAPGGATFQLVATQHSSAGCPSEVASSSTAAPIVLYQSPVLSGVQGNTRCSFDDNPGVYCSEHVVLNALNLAVSNATTFSLVFANNQRNVQLLLPAPLTLTWGAVGGGVPVTASI